MEPGVHGGSRGQREPQTPRLSGAYIYGTYCILPGASLERGVHGGPGGQREPQATRISGTLCVLLSPTTTPTTYSNSF